MNYFKLNPNIEDFGPLAGTGSNFVPVKMLLETEGKWVTCKCPWTETQHEMGHWTEHQRYVTPWEKIDE